VHSSGKYNFESVRQPVPSNLNINAFRDLLRHYDDKDICNFLEFGWPINHSSILQDNTDPNNHGGVNGYLQQIDDYLIKEIDNGSVIGPFKVNPFGIKITVSPLNAVPKKDTQEPRVILDLSYPTDSSINSGVSVTNYLGEEVSTTYPRVDDLVDLVHKQGKGCLLFKKDLKKAYRQIPIDPKDIPLLGYRWRGSLYFDCALPMGLRSSAYICQRVTTAVSYIMGERGFSILNYLDDFAGAERPETAGKAYMTLEGILDQLGLRESPGKACSPSQVMSFLGVLFDTDKLTLEVTPDRLIEINDLLTSWRTKQHTTRKEVESLVGKLMFISRCVRGSRVFMSRMLSALSSMDDRLKYDIDVEMRKDLKWWSCFMNKFNGTVIMPFQDWSCPDKVIAVDACLSGIGGICWETGEVFHKRLPDEYKLCYHINELESLCLVVSLKIWGQSLVRKKLLIFSDNMVTVSVVNSGRSSSPFLQTCIREIAFIMCRNESEIRAIHIEGVANRVPDYLSRWHTDGKYEALFWHEMVKINSLMEIKELPISDDFLILNNTW